MAEASESKNIENKSGVYKIVNAYDDLVRTTVRELMDTMDMCKCEKCFLDVCAIVFNRQYSHFVTTREGELLDNMTHHLNYGNRAELTVIAMDALTRVKNTPNH